MEFISSGMARLEHGTDGWGIPKMDVLFFILLAVGIWWYGAVWRSPENVAERALQRAAKAETITAERGAIHTISEAPDLTQLAAESLLLAHILQKYDTERAAGVADDGTVATLSELSHAVSVLANHVLAQH